MSTPTPIESLIEYTSGQDVRNTSWDNDGSPISAPFADGRRYGVFKKSAIVGGAYGSADNWDNALPAKTTGLGAELVQHISKNKGSGGRGY